MVPDWQTTRAFFSTLLPLRHQEVWRGLRNALGQSAVEFHLLKGTHDIWCRDYMPVQVNAGEFVKFHYEPDYLRDRKSLITNPAVCCSVSRTQGLCRSKIKVDGGNVVGAGHKVILTEKVIRENPNSGRQELKVELERLLRAECVFIPEEPGDEIGHADGIVRFFDEETLIVNNYRNVDAGYGKHLIKILRSHGFLIEELPYFCTEEVVDGIPSAVGNYLNFFRVEGLIVVPAYGVPEDEIACRKLESLLRGTKIMPIRCNGLAREGGVLNCESWTVRADQRKESPARQI
jgi:agmatine deiminase